MRPWQQVARVYNLREKQFRVESGQIAGWFVDQEYRLEISFVHVADQFL